MWNICHWLLSNICLNLLPKPVEEILVVKMDGVEIHESAMGDNINPLQALL